MLAESKLTELSMDFAVRVLELCDHIKGHYSLVNQLERSATSIGANIREANYAHSRADFVSKLQIALKQNTGKSGFGAVDRLHRSPIVCVQGQKRPENAGVLFVVLYG